MVSLCFHSHSIYPQVSFLKRRIRRLCKLFCDTIANRMGGSEATVLDEMKSRVDRVLEVMKGSTDEHKFGGLMMLTHLMKQNGYFEDISRDEKLRGKILEAVSSAFVFRMFRTKGAGKLLDLLEGVMDAVFHALTVVQM